jgi:hypothetical protein
MSKILDFTRCESDGSFLIPVVGSAWTKAGTPTYSAGKWGNGNSPSSSNNWSKYIATGLQKFSITFSAKMTNASDTNSGFLYDVIGGYAGSYNVGTQLNINIGNVASYPKGCVPYLFTMNAWSAGDVIDLAYLFDTTASAGSKIVVYQNCVSLGAPTSYTEYSGGDFSQVGVGINIRLGYSTLTNIVIDNVKVWDGVITTAEILSARNNERAGMNDQVIL